MKYKETADRLRKALEEKNMKASELAEKSKVQKSAISLYINGNRIPTNLAASKMGEVLGVSPVWLMGFDVPMKSETFNLLKNQLAQVGSQAERLASVIEGMSEDQIAEVINFAEYIKNVRK